MWRNEKDVQREQKHMSICALEGDAYMHALGGWHWQDSTAEKRYGLSGFHSAAKKQQKHTMGILLAQLRNHGSTLQGSENALCWFQKATTAAGKVSWAGIATASYFFDNKWGVFLVRTGRKDSQMVRMVAWNLAHPISTTDFQNNLAQAALTSLCFCSSSAKWRAESSEKDSAMSVTPSSSQGAQAQPHAEQQLSLKVQEWKRWPSQTNRFSNSELMLYLPEVSM